MIVRESISFERYKDPKKALGLDVYDDFLKYRDKKMYVDKNFGWAKSDGWIRSIEVDPDLDDETKISWINCLQKKDIGLSQVYSRYTDKNVRESISFERYKDPKRALGLLPYEFWWDNLAPGDKFEIIEDLPELKYKKGDYIEIFDVTPIEHDEKNIIRNTYRGNEELNFHRSWEFGFEFFKETFKKIK